MTGGPERLGSCLDVRRWDRIVAARAAGDDQGLDNAWVDQVIDLGSQVRRRARGMIHAEAAANLEEAELQAALGPRPRGPGRR